MTTATVTNLDLPTLCVGGPVIIIIITLCWAWLAVLRWVMGWPFANILSLYVTTCSCLLSLLP